MVELLELLLTTALQVNTLFFSLLSLSALFFFFSSQFLITLRPMSWMGRMGPSESRWKRNHSHGPCRRAFRRGSGKMFFLAFFHSFFHPLGDSHPLSSLWPCEIIIWNIVWFAGLCPDWEDWGPDGQRNADEAMALAEKYLGVAKVNLLLGTLRKIIYAHLCFYFIVCLFWRDFYYPRSLF